jgi:hypothetical protein
VNEKYTDLLDTTFDTLDEVLHFQGVLDTELPHATFIVFDSRCPVCNSNEAAAAAAGHWAYTDSSPLTISTLLDFIRHLKNNCFLCEHERVHSVKTCHFLCIIQINVTSGEVQKAPSTSERYNR